MFCLLTISNDDSWTLIWGKTWTIKNYYLIHFLWAALEGQMLTSFSGNVVKDETYAWNTELEDIKYRSEKLEDFIESGNRVGVYTWGFVKLRTWPEVWKTRTWKLPFISRENNPHIEEPPVHCSMEYHIFRPPHANSLLLF